MANKLGRDTNSVVNWMMGNSKSPMPEVGMGATLMMWTDRHAYTIHKVEGKKLWASSDVATRTDKNGYYTESQDYTYSNDDADKPDRWGLFTLRNDGRWHAGTTKHGSVLVLGFRREYCDPCF
jgi:hypothetical protein